VNKHAEIVESIYAKAPLEFLISKGEKPELVPIESSHALSHKIIDNIKSVYIEIDQALDRAKMEFFIGELLWEGK
jgi:G3E family GTPase